MRYKLGLLLMALTSSCAERDYNAKDVAGSGSRPAAPSASAAAPLSLSGPARSSATGSSVLTDYECVCMNRAAPEAVESSGPRRARVCVPTSQVQAYLTDKAARLRIINRERLCAADAGCAGIEILGQSADAGEAESAEALENSATLRADCTSSNK